jgi:predicted dehydrogenase
MADNRVLKVGLIGCGNVVSYGHRPALTSLPDVRLVALADVTEARRKIGQEWFGLADADLLSDYRDLLRRDDVDAVVVTVPQQFRREIVLDAFAAGKHVLSEKPVALTPAIAAELIAAADARGLTFGVVHNYHFLPEYRKIKQLIDSGAIGELRVLTMHYLGVIDYPGAKEYQDDWRHKLGAGGGVLVDMIHALYLAEWLFGATAEQVSAFVDAPTYAQRQPQVEDLALVQIAYPGGYAAVHMGWGQGVGGVDASGSAGQLRMRYHQYQTSGFNRPAELYTVQDWQRTDHEMDSLPEHMQNIGRSFTQLWADFRDAIRQKRQPIAPARAAARALEVALAAYLSGVTGRVVNLSLPPEHPVYQKGIYGLSDVDVWDESRTRRAGIFGLRE